VGGIAGEDGLTGIRLGHGPDGEAFTAFQSYIGKLKNKGIILAVCSKNNPDDAREIFEKHDGMRLSFDDIALFVTNWETKTDNLRLIAKTLNIGLDSLVLVDDNPVERQAIRTLLPEVEVIPLAADPAGYIRCLGGYLGFETWTWTSEDGQRAQSYRALARAAEMAPASLEEFHRGLRMKAAIRPFVADDLRRIEQLIGKTNQFNVTTRRHKMQNLRDFMADPRSIHFSLSLRDSFADHGLVAVMIAFVENEAATIDTWLMSCRVIGRTVEQEMLAHLAARAAEAGCKVLRGTYIPTTKNAMVKDLFARLGFDRTAGSEAGSEWQLALENRLPLPRGLMETALPEALLSASST